VKTKKKYTTTKTSLDLSKALNLSASEALDWELRYKISQKIISIVTKKSLSVTEVSKLVGTSRSRITKILKGDTQGISLDILVKIIACLGHKINIKFPKAA